MRLTINKTHRLDVGQTFAIAKAYLAASSSFQSRTPSQTKRLLAKRPCDLRYTYPSTTGKQNTAVRFAQTLTSVLRRKVHLPVLLHDKQLPPSEARSRSVIRSAVLVLHVLNRLRSAPLSPIFEAQTNNPRPQFATLRPLLPSLTFV
ncbi:MAG: hypothetical protein ACTS6G_03690 [Candidatus Hodgkinia cicadicola]